LVAGKWPLIVLDPIFGMPMRFAILMMGVVELMAAAFCFFGRQPNFQLALIAWLSINFLIYRMGLLWQGAHTTWGCLGNSISYFRFSSGEIDIGLDLVLAFFLLGSCILLLLTSTKRWTQFNDFRRMSCPSCGGRIQFSERNLGQKIPCPHCQEAITLRGAENLKMSCFFCREHIEFPAHAIGEKLKCPHCNMDITLKEQANI
jgi:hypothetical protein